MSLWSGLRVEFEHAWGRGTLPADDDPGERRKGEVLITVDGTPLDWRSSLMVRNHSPTGPAWGYGTRQRELFGAAEYPVHVGSGTIATTSTSVDGSSENPNPA